MNVQESFLLDEVRCGFFVPAAIKQAWAAQLEVLMEIDRVCKLHDIEYFADWGTLLGAVRHGGFVPWDDDLDIVMKREDYQKFMTVARFDMEEGFDVQTFRNQKDFWLFMGKVVGKNRFCFEKDHLRRFHNFPYIACVDIFVLDYAHRDPAKEEERKTICKYMLGIADGIVEGQFTEAEKESHLQTLEEMSEQHYRRIADPVEMGKYLYGEVEKRFVEVPPWEADYLVQMFPWGLKQNVNYYPKEYYEKAVRIPFECIEMPVPPLYDKMLRMRYGEYWRLVKDGGAHNYPFFEGQKVNLQKVLDFNLPVFCFDRGMLERSQEEKEVIQYSYKTMARECVAELQQMKEELISEIETLCVPELEALLGKSQQLAVELGTLLEQIKGEGCVVVGALERYCEVLYHIYEWVQGESAELSKNTQQSIIAELCQAAERISTELEESILKRKAILFLPVMAKDWNSLHSLWQAAKEDENCDVYVAPLPYYYKDYDSSAKKICYEDKEFPKEVTLMDYKMLIQEYLELLHPEIIVIQNPYDAWHPAISVPKMFYSQKLKRYTDKLIYMPPFKVSEFTKDNAREYANMQYYVTLPGVVYADKVIVQSPNMKQVYVEKLTEFAGEDTRAYWEEKILPLELLFMDKERKKIVSPEKKCKKLLYGISSSILQESPDAAHKKIDENLKLFEAYKEKLEVTFIHFPEEKIASVDEFDAYYGDPMPVMMEFVQDDKPVMIQLMNV